MEVVRGLHDAFHDLCSLILPGRGRDGPGFGLWLLLLGRSLAPGNGSLALGTELGECSLQLLPERLLALLALNETLALGERERVVSARHGLPAFSAASQGLLDAARRHGPLCALHRLGLLFGDLTLVCFGCGSVVVTVDIPDGAVVVDLAPGLEHALVLTVQVVLHLRLRQVRIEVLRGLHGRIHRLGLLRAESIDHEVSRENQGEINQGRNHVLRLPEVNSLCQFHLLAVLVSWCVICRGASPGESPPACSRLRGTPDGPCTPWRTGRR